MTRFQIEDKIVANKDRFFFECRLNFPEVVDMYYLALFEFKMEQVILVDENDRALGTMGKMEAHQKGILHRAFSILLFNDEGKILLQKRSQNKYHSSGLWTNACCSHPIPGEDLREATRRRLREEMGIELQPAFSHTFIYKAHLDNNLVEHELDHVFIGTFNGVPRINLREVEDWKFVDLGWLKDDMVTNSSDYTEWFKLIVANLPPRLIHISESSPD